MMESKNITRRTFVGTSAMAAAAAMLSGCSSAASDLVESAADDQKNPEEDGRWITCDCWDNCGGRCLNKILMCDGVPIRQKTDDTHEDSFDWPQQRACPRGRARRSQIFGEDRLKYPMKRTHWSADDPHGELRGKDTWQRISWDEALDLVATQIRTTIDRYGNRAILATHRPDPRKQVTLGLLSYLGGFVQELDSHSYGVFGFDVPKIGLGPMGWTGGVSRYDLLKCENIVLYGANTAWSAPGTPPLILMEAKNRGAQFVSVGPDYNATASLLGARWIPVRPGTDTALLLGVAYCMLVADDADKGSVVDWDFLNTYTVGFDADHMPADAKTNENFEDYLRGAYDDVPKTAEWASEICGTPVEDIEWLAQLLGRKNSVGMFHSFGPARCKGAESFPQLFYTVGAMGGHMGREGHACTNCNEATAFNAGSNAVSYLSAAEPPIPNPLDEWIPAMDLWQAVIDGHYTYTGNYLYGSGKAAAPEERDIDIHLIWHSHQAAIHTAPNVNKAIEAHRKVDCVIADGLSYTPNVQYADIVLPVCSAWETWMPGSNTPGANIDTQIYPQKVCDPLYESKSDVWIACELAKRLGVDPDAICPKSEEQLFFDYTAGSTTTDDAGNKIHLVSLTQEDIDRWHDELGIEWPTGPQDGLMTMDELLEAGVYTRKRSDGDGVGTSAWQAFVADAEANPLPSNSGKLEVYCQAYADECNMQGRSTIKPYPTYQVTPESYQDSFTDWDSKERGDYTFQMFTPHYLRRAHTVMDNSSWMREAFENPVFMNKDDVAKLGLECGDTVRVYNDRGSVLRQVQPSACFMPGVLAMPHGAWPDIDEDGVDHAGSENVLIGGKTTGWGVSGYNTTLVAVEKYDGDGLQADCDLPARIAEVEGQ